MIQLIRNLRFRQLVIPSLATGVTMLSACGQRSTVPADVVTSKPPASLV